MTDNKDRFGKKMRDKEKAEEDRYFAEQDRAKLDRIKQSSVPDVPRGMCPRCGLALVEQDHLGVATDVCETCGGVWLDRGELEQIEQRDEEHWPSTWFRSILNQVLPKPPKQS